MSYSDFGASALDETEWEKHSVFSKACDKSLNFQEVIRLQHEISFLIHLKLIGSD